MEMEQARAAGIADATVTVADVSLSRQAATLLDYYLARVQSLARGLSSVSVPDVTADVREHILSSLRGKVEPIAATDMQTALQRVGPAEQWLPLEELPQWRQAARRLLGSPRLPYVAFALLVGGMMLPLDFACVLVAASFCLARAGLSQQTPAHQWQRWLLYPPLVVTYTVGLSFLIFWPSVAVVGGTYDAHALPARISRWIPLSQGQTLPISAGVAAVGLWAAVTGLLLTIRPALIRATLYPFAEHISRWKLLLFAAAGLGCTAIGVIFLRG
jgi:hypothetical protein